MRGDTSKFIIGFAIGAISGVVAGILLAPDSGKNTRKKIMDKGNQLKQDLQDFSAVAKETIADSVDEYWNAGKSKKTKSYR